MLTKLFALGFIAGSIILASLIIFDEPNSQSPSKVARPSLKRESGFQITNAETITEHQSANNKQSNSTQKIAERISQNILTQDAKNPLSLPKPEKLVDDYLTEAIQDFDITNLRPPADTAKITVIPENGSTVLEDYFRGLTIILNRLDVITLDSQNLTAADFKKIAGAYEAAGRQLYQLPTPKTVLDLHSRQISLMTAQRNIFNILANYQEDPAKALIAAQANLTLAEEFNDLKNKIQQFIVKHRLGI